MCVCVRARPLARILRCRYGPIWVSSLFSFLAGEEVGRSGGQAGQATQAYLVARVCMAAWQAWQPASPAAMGAITCRWGLHGRPCPPSSPPTSMSSTTGRLAAGQAGLSLPSALFPLGRDGERPRERRRTCTLGDLLLGRAGI